MNAFSKTILVACISLTSTLASAKQCFQVSRSASAFSRTPELLCIAESGSAAIITLGIRGPRIETYSETHLELLKRVRCADCNADEFGLSNPSNSSFAAILSVKFNGKRNVSTGEESGTVTVGGNKLFYRSVAK